MPYNTDLIIKYEFHKKIHINRKVGLTLKVPKHENFSIAFFALSGPIWVGDSGTEQKYPFFYQLNPDFDGFWFLASN